MYASSYDPWGNVTSRTYNSTTATATLTCDHFVSWNAGSQSKNLDVYDASGTRVLRRSTTSSGTIMTVYAFGLEEHTYFNAGGHTGNVVHAGGAVANLATAFSSITLPYLRFGRDLLTSTSLRSFMAIFSFKVTCYFAV